MPRLTCTAFRRDYSAFRDGHLPVDRVERMQGHLDECESCRRRHRALEIGVALLRRLAPYPDEAPRFADDRLT